MKFNIKLILKLLIVSRLPQSTEGEWWELSDESRGGIPYYFHTKTNETVWERPDGFVIPLGILQVGYIYFYNIIEYT